MITDDASAEDTTSVEMYCEYGNNLPCLGLSRENSFLPCPDALHFPLRQSTAIWFVIEIHLEIFFFFMKGF